MIVRVSKARNIGSLDRVLARLASLLYFAPFACIARAFLVAVGEMGLKGWRSNSLKFV